MTDHGSTCYEIHYGYGWARFWTTTTSDPAQVLEQFESIASGTFGIRKNMFGAPRITSTEPQPFPQYHDGQGGTHALQFLGDEYLFDATWARVDDGHPWELHHAWGDDCICPQRGTPTEACAVHNFAFTDGWKYEERAE